MHNDISVGLLFTHIRLLLCFLLGGEMFDIAITGYLVWTVISFSVSCRELCTVVKCLSVNGLYFFNG